MKMSRAGWERKKHDFGPAFGILKFPKLLEFHLYILISTYPSISEQRSSTGGRNFFLINLIEYLNRATLTRL